jgi:DNA-binding transcriptional LysR family regulator
MHSLLRDVEYFAAIAEHGQLQLAAAALGLSQPALSMSLRRLEQAVNAKLFKRTPKGVELTSVGSALLARVKQLRLSVDDVTREIADLSVGRAGHLRIGMIESRTQVVAMACAALLKDAPGLTLVLTTNANGALTAELRNGALDVVVTVWQFGNDEGVIDETLYDEEIAIYASVNHRLAKRRALTLTELAREGWTLPSVDTGGVKALTQAFRNLGLPPPKLVVEASSVMARFHLVATSDLLTFGPRPLSVYTAGHPGVVDLRVKYPSPDRHVSVRYREDAYLPPAAYRFIEILKKVTGEMRK